MLKFAKYLSLALLFTALLPAHAQQAPGQHPAYLHALSDLRAARWLLSHQPGDLKVFEGEDIAIQEIEAAIREIKAASIDDGKNINDHPPIDVNDHGSRLLKSLEFLKKAKADIDQEEDNPFNHELRHRANDHINRAFDAATRAHNAWLHEMGR